MKKTKKALKLSQIYTYIEEDNCYLAQISLDSYDEIFNAWDAAPAKRRDLETDLLEFIEQAAYDIPIREHIKFIFQLPKELKDEKKEAVSIEAIYHNFRTVNHFINKELAKNNRKILTYFVLGIIFLSASYFFQITLNSDYPFSILVDGLFIGGWVMFWEAFSVFFFTGFELRNRRKRFNRFSNSRIVFVYE
ncbi:MAG: hypothetical protein JEZ05_10620 [Tenericutes bacterium]|nr:hypothetical protein [Mycoplasmatota bacterium]